MQQIDMEYQAALCTKAWIQNPEIDYGAIAVDLDATVSTTIHLLCAGEAQHGSTGYKWDLKFRQCLAIATNITVHSTYVTQSRSQRNDKKSKNIKKPLCKPRDT